MKGQSWQQAADVLAAKAVAEGEPTAWFERLYAGRSERQAELPWDREQAHALLRSWAERDGIRGDGRRAVVVGTGLGKDAEFVASLGFETTAFDVSPTAVSLASSRIDGVDFVVADLFDLPDDWAQAFDLVVEIFTVQALPVDLRTAAVPAVTSLVAPGGTLFVIQAVRDDGEEVAGPPWPLTRAEVTSFADHGLDQHELEHFTDPGNPGYRRWRVVFTRPAE